MTLYLTNNNEFILLTNMYLNAENIYIYNIMSLNTFESSIITNDIIDNYTEIQFNKENLLKVLNTNDKFNVIILDDIEFNLITLFDVNYQIYEWIDIINILMTL